MDKRCLPFWQIEVWVSLTLKGFSAAKEWLLSSLEWIRVGDVMCKVTAVPKGLLNELQSSFREDTCWRSRVQHMFRFWVILYFIFILNAFLRGMAENTTLLETLTNYIYSGSLVIWILFGWPMILLSAPQSLESEFCLSSTWMIFSHSQRLPALELEPR